MTIDVREHEQRLPLFFESLHRRRWRTLLDSGRRQDALSDLDRRVSLDARYQIEISGKGGGQSPDSIHLLLKSRGAPNRCYVISTDLELDQSEKELRAAIEAADGGTTILSCIPGRLGYFESHEGDRYVLERPA